MTVKHNTSRYNLYIASTCSGRFLCHLVMIQWCALHLIFQGHPDWLRSWSWGTESLFTNSPPEDGRHRSANGARTAQSRWLTFNYGVEDGWKKTLSLTYFAFGTKIMDVWCNEVVLNFASSSLVPYRDLGWQLSIPFCATYSFQLFDLSQLSGRLPFEICFMCFHHFSTSRSHMDGKVVINAKQSICHAKTHLQNTTLNGGSCVMELCCWNRSHAAAPTPSPPETLPPPKIDAPKEVMALGLDGMKKFVCCKVRLVLSPSCFLHGILNNEFMWKDESVRCWDVGMFRLEAQKVTSQICRQRGG